MDKSITFHIKSEEKEKIRILAESSGLGMSPFCRVVMLQKLKENKEEIQE